MFVELQCPGLVDTGDFGICAFTCGDDNPCTSKGQLCCPTKCGGTTCVEGVNPSPPSKLVDL